MVGDSDGYKLGISLFISEGTKEGVILGTDVAQKENISLLPKLPCASFIKTPSRVIL